MTEMLTIDVEAPFHMRTTLGARGAALASQECAPHVHRSKTVANADRFYRHFVDSLDVLVPLWESNIRLAYDLFSATLARRPALRVTLCVGNLRTGAVSVNRTDIRISAEYFCRTIVSDDAHKGLGTWFQHWSRSPERLRTTVVHEMTHCLQSPPAKQDLLHRCFREGIAEQMAILLTGSATADAAITWLQRHRTMVQRRFWTDCHASRSIPWLDCNPAEHGLAWPPNVGYAVGQQFVEEWLGTESAKGRSVKDLLGFSSADEIFNQTTWSMRPGHLAS